jgi:hypothetical protein
MYTAALAAHIAQFTVRAALRSLEPPEKQEQITLTYALILQVRQRGVALPKCGLPVRVCGDYAPPYVRVKVALAIAKFASQLLNDVAVRHAPITQFIVSRPIGVGYRQR